MRLLQSARRSIYDEGLVPRLVVAGATIVTILAQHPHPNFNRMRAGWDVFSIVPNWKFFAPHPAVKDYHYAYRVRLTSGETLEWREIYLLEPRKIHQAIWFASRRTGKAVFDICSSLMTRMTAPNSGSPRMFPEYKLLTEFIRRQAQIEYPNSSVDKFQFAIVETSGYDKSEDPEPVFLSRPERFH